MTADAFTREVEDAWPEVLADSSEVLEQARLAWLDADRVVVLDDEGRDDS